MFYSKIAICCFVTVFFGGIASQQPDCSLPKSSGNGKDAVQKFYYNSEWHTCFGFKYTGKGGNENKFSTYSECMGKCAPLDGTACSGKSLSKSPLNDPAFDCDMAKCPKGYKCIYGTRPECCEAKEYDAFQAAAADNCPDGSKSGGSNENGYFTATYGETCNDLVCQKGMKCVQVKKYFAKCCGGK
uniref:BPTI/Kunitz inhibitor domain-containing protein n=1 Tax=Panagrolaimus sp. ES5 TaxID=591445 RepID=A0AC34FHN3_9BILA